MHAVTIPVSKVTPSAEQWNRCDLLASIEPMLQRRVEAMALSDDRLVWCRDTNPFAAMVHVAFYQHYPLTITPDDIWFCIAQGFAHHVNLNAEALRHKFVRHEGKAELLVVREDFELGQPNPWEEVFSAFSDQIADHIGRPLRDTIVADFTTTTPIHRAASEILLMDAFQAYFEYTFACGCGIPSVTVKGAPDDWRNIRRRAETLAQYGLEHWVKVLLPVLDRIEATSRGHGNPEFWESFFRYQSFSGGGTLTGWIHVLFPYLKDSKAGSLVPNQFLQTWPDDVAAAKASRSVSPGRSNYEEVRGPSLWNIPSGLSSAPVLFKDLRKRSDHKMRFVAGLFGFAQDPKTLGMSTSFGWAIVDDEKRAPQPFRDRFNRNRVK